MLHEFLFAKCLSVMIITLCLCIDQTSYGFYHFFTLCNDKSILSLSRSFTQECSLLRCRRSRRSPTSSSNNNVGDLVVRSPTSSSSNILDYSHRTAPPSHQTLHLLDLSTSIPCTNTTSRRRRRTRD